MLDLNFQLRATTVGSQQNALRCGAKLAFLECHVTDPAPAGNLAENLQTPTISERDFFKTIEFQENRFNTF